MLPRGHIQKMQTQKRTHYNPMGVIPLTTLPTPIVRIENHESEILSCDIHQSGKYILSSDRQGHIHVCDSYGTFSRMMVMRGHIGPVLNAKFSLDGYDVYSCSTDKTLGIWDTLRGCRKAKLEGHTGSVNSVQGIRTGRSLLCSGSNDGTLRLWDTREQNCVLALESGGKIMDTCFSKQGEYIYSGGADNDIKVWDSRRREMLYSLNGHTDMITGISLSPCGLYLLSHSVDNTLRIWDVSPHVELDRHIRWFQSNQGGAGGNLLRCSWSDDGSMISAGTVERDVYIWDAFNGDILHELPGHESCINDVIFHPEESIVLSASNDKYLFLHEI